MVRGMRFPISDDHPSSIVLESRKPLVLGNAPHDLFHSPENSQRQTLSWMGVPLIVRDNLMGMLSIHSSSQDYFQPDHVRLATTFAAQVAIALENVRLYNAEHQQALESDALRLTLADISAELELSKLLDAVLQRAAELLQASGGELALYNEARKDLFVVSSYNMGRDYTGVRMQVGEGVIGWVAQHLSEVTIEDYNHWEGRSPQLLDVPWYSIIAAPLLVSSRLVGVIGVVDDNNQRSFTQSDRRILNLFAQQAAIAVGNAHLYLEARQAADRRAILHRVSQEIISARPEPEDIYEMIHTAATRLAPSEAFVITLYDPENDEIDAVYLVDHDERISPRKVPPDQGLSGYILKTGETIYIEDLQNHASEYTPLRFGRSETIRSVLAVPIRLGNQILGMLSCQSYQPYAYNDEDKYLLEMLASYAAVALTNSRLFNEVQRLAVTDPLTDLYNRRELFELGEREVRRSKRLKRALSLILLDLDDFKLVNDRFGHDVGDRVLVHLAGVLQKSIREIDTLARYGGEEFVILLPETNIKSATIIAERIRKLVNETFVLVGDYQVKVTASIGVTCISADTMDLTEMISVADSAMYTAKNSGRNRVAVSG